MGFCPRAAFSKDVENTDGTGVTDNVCNDFRSWA